MKRPTDEEWEAMSPAQREEAAAKYWADEVLIRQKAWFDWKKFKK